MALTSGTKVPHLNVVKYPSTLRFDNCCLQNIPDTKPDVKQVIETLKDFSDHDQLELRHVHKLKDDGRFKTAQTLIDQYPTQTLWSVDVYTRNGLKGNYRLIYYRDGNIAQVVAVFIDTHK